MPDLFTLDTTDVRLVWRRQRPLAVPVPPAPTARPFGLGTEGADVWVNAEAEQHLFEQTEYTLLAESKTGRPIAVAHRDPRLLRGLTAVDAGRRWLGPVNFGGQVGDSRFRVTSGGRDVLAFDVEVFPSKLDYRHDFEALVAEVQRAEASLALAYVQATQHTARSTAHRRPDALEWLWLLTTALDDLEPALAHVAAQPHRQIEPEATPVRADAVRRPDARLIRHIAQGRGTGPFALSDPPIRTTLPHHRPTPTLDTPAHRWLRHQLASARRRLAHLQIHWPLRRARDARTHDDLHALQQRLGRLLALPPLREAVGPPPTAPTPELLGAPGYREAHAACLRLAFGLELGKGRDTFALRDLHRLYEYACFLILVRALADLTGTPVPASDLVAYRDGRPTLRLGQRNAVRFDLGGGRRVRLAYNPHFAGRELLVPQRPDLLLTVDEPGEPPRRFVLDAKYRVDASAGYVRRFGMPGPPEDALGTLHRYRDALRPSGDIVHAVALYPHRPAGDAWQQARLWTSIFDVGVGAMPLLPGVEAPLRAWLRWVLG